MPSPRSSVSRHPHRHVVERLLCLRSIPLRDLGQRFGLSPWALCRHRQAMTAEEVAAAILGNDVGLSREELLALCHRQHDSIPTSLATRRQRLEHAAAIAAKTGDWATLSAIDARLHAIDEFIHRLFGPVMEGLSAVDVSQQVTRIERVVIRADQTAEKEPLEVILQGVPSPQAGEGPAPPPLPEPEPEPPPPPEPPRPEPSPTPTRSNVVPIHESDSIFGFSSITGKR